MQETTLAKLNDKVSSVVEKYKELKKENETLRIEIVKLKAQNDIKDQEIEKLIEQNTSKDEEIESIVEKLESIMV